MKARLIGCFALGIGLLVSRPAEAVRTLSVGARAGWAERFYPGASPNLLIEGAECFTYDTPIFSPSIRFDPSSCPDTHAWWVVGVPTERQFLPSYAVTMSATITSNNGDFEHLCAKAYHRDGTPWSSLCESFPSSGIHSLTVTTPQDGIALMIGLMGGQSVFHQVKYQRLIYF